MIDKSMLRRAKPAAVLRLARWLQSRGELSMSLPLAQRHLELSVEAALRKIDMQTALARIARRDAERATLRSRCCGASIDEAHRESGTPTYFCTDCFETVERT